MPDLNWWDRLAREHGWKRTAWQPNIQMVSYVREGCRMNIYLTTGTISTSLRHPTKGRTQLFRRKLRHEQIVAVLKKPRAHVGCGYYRRDGGCQPQPPQGILTRELRDVLQIGSA